VEKSLLDYLLNQTTGIVAAGVLLWLYVRERRDTERRLAEIIKERRNDRDELLRLLVRVESHLARSDAFEGFARSALRDTLDPKNPRRRETDALLMTALEKELQIQTAAASDPPPGARERKANG